MSAAINDCETASGGEVQPVLEQPREDQLPDGFCPLACVVREIEPGVPFHDAQRDNTERRRVESDGVDVCTPGLERTKLSGQGGLKIGLVSFVKATWHYKIIKQRNSFAPPTSAQTTRQEHRGKDSRHDLSDEERERAKTIGEPVFNPWLLKNRLHVPAMPREDALPYRGERIDDLQVLRPNQLAGLEMRVKGSLRAQE